MGKSIIITSGKGGVGKSTCAANIGAALADMGYSVVLVDGDMGLRNLDVIMGLENRIVFTSLDAALKKCTIKSALVKDRHSDNLFLLPAEQHKNIELMTPEHMEWICRSLKEAFDYVLIDCPAGIDRGYRTSVAGADEAIVITTPEVAAIRDADKIIGVLSSDGICQIRLVINKIRSELMRSGNMVSCSDIENILGVKSIGYVPDDKTVVVNTNRGQLSVRTFRSVAGREFRKIAGKISGNRTLVSRGEEMSAVRI